MQDQNRAYVYAILSVMLWSTVATAFKLTLRYLSFTGLLFYSSLSATLVLFIIVLLQKKLTRLKKYSAREFAYSAGLGFLNPFLYYLVLFRAYDLLPAQEAQPLNFTWPVVLVLLSVPLLRQQISLKSVAAICVSFTGVVIIGTQGNIASLSVSNPVGFVLAVGSSVIWSLYWIYNMMDMRDEVVKLFLNFLSGFILTLVFLLFTEGIPLPAPEAAAGAVYVGLFEMGITFVFWMKALRLSKTTAKVSNLIYLSPFISLFFIGWIVGEKILISTVLGLSFIIGGIILQQRVK